MISMKRTTFAFAIMLVMIFSSMALGHAERIQNVSQTDETRVVSKETFLSVGTQIIKGSNEEGVQLIFSRSGMRRFSNISRGGAEVTFPSSDTIHIEGDLNNTQVAMVREVRTFAQKDEYINNVSVGERVRRVHEDRRVSPPTTISINETFDIPFTYEDLDSNENYTKVMRRGLALFVARTGGMIDVPVNDSDGNEIGRILAFRFRIHIVAFFEDTKEFVANYRSTEFGYGNMVPNTVRDRVRNGTSLPDRVDRRVIGRDRLNTTQPSIEWIDLGYNATYDLNMSMGIFHFNRHAKLILVAPARDRPSDYLELHALDADFESLIDAYAAANEMQELDTMEIDELDLSLVDEALTVENFDLAAATEGRQLPINLTAFLLPFFLAIPLLKPKRKN